LESITDHLNGTDAHDSMFDDNAHTIAHDDNDGDSGDDAGLQ
jgi:hypothetical protein